MVIMKTYLQPTPVLVHKNITDCILRLPNIHKFDCFRQKYPDGIKFGEVIYDRETGKLNCYELCHIHLEKYTQERGDNHIEVTNISQIRYW